MASSRPCCAFEARLIHRYRPRLVTLTAEAPRLVRRHVYPDTASDELEQLGSSSTDVMGMSRDGPPAGRYHSDVRAVTCSCLYLYCAHSSPSPAVVETCRSRMPPPRKSAAAEPAPPLAAPEPFTLAAASP